MENIQRQADEDKAKFEVQMSVLNENLTTVRGDLVSNQTALEEATKLNDILMGEKLGNFSAFIYLTNSVCSWIVIKSLANQCYNNNIYLPLTHLL